MCQRALLFALVCLIHAGLWHLLRTRQQSPTASPEQQRTVLVFLEDAPIPARAPVEIAPAAPPRRPEASQRERAAPTLIAPPQNDATAPPIIDWRREAEETARKHAIEAEANHPNQGEPGALKPKPEFHWSHSRTHRIEPMENGGFVVWINDKCGVAISMMAMPFCKIGKKPPRGDLFEHMDDPPTPGDWKDD